ncbi:hypothetical protein PHISP_00731 [Aspergillus sp. HF37]|nr:hypothetical protein PHISP_00731 [Aspergillus sp. HF37]
MPTNGDSAAGTILEGLPSTTRQYPYKGLEDFWSQVDQERERFRNDQTRDSSDYVIFTSVDNQAFTRDFDDTTKHKSSWRLFNSYESSSQLLLVRAVTTEEHETAHTGLFNLMVVKLAGMDGAHMKLVPTGKAEVKTASRTKKADQAFRPRERPHGRPKLWPTLVMVVEYHQSSAKLESDARWWLTESEGDVKTVLTISVNRKKPEIVIQKWGPASAGNNFPSVLQQVVISRPGGHPETAVANAPLVLPFESLFLRQPVGVECDVLFTDSDLIWLAEVQVWGAQKF